MRKNVFGRQLKRDSNERKALFKGLISSLILHERIKTTEEKAKSIKSLADKIVTKAKKGEEKARQLLQGQLSKKVLDKLIFKIAPRFETRQGGYTRIIKIGRRFSDNASVVILEWTEQNEVKSPALPAGKSKLSPRAQVEGLKVQSLDKEEEKDKQNAKVEDMKDKEEAAKGKRLLKAIRRKTKKK